MAEAFQMSVEILRIYTKLLRDLREVVDKRWQDFTSAAFKNMSPCFSGSCRTTFLRR
jgi:hypothetical protein